MMLFFCCQFVIECFLSLYFIRFENLTINGKHISDDMPDKPGWYKTADMAKIYVNDHVEGLTFSK